MIKSLDIYRQGFLRRFQAGAVPEFVAQASLLNKTAAMELPATAFADPATRDLPLDSKESTWLSMAYLADHPSIGTPTLKQMIDKAAMMWQLTDKEKEAAQTTPLEKAASAPAAGTIVFKDPLTGVDHVTNVYTETDLKEAADFLLHKRASFSYPARAAASRNILSIANRAFPDALDEDRIDMLRKVAGLGTSDGGALMKAVAYRKALVTNPERVEILQLLHKEAASSVLEQAPILRMDFLSKAAAALDVIDKLEHLIARGVPFPEDSLFAISPAAVQAASKEFAHTGNASSMQLSKIAADFPRIQRGLFHRHKTKVSTPEEAMGTLSSLTPLQRARVLASA